MTIARSELRSMGYKDVATGRRLDPVHPGEILLHEFIEPMELSRYRVAKALGVQQRRVDEICAGARSITADTAVRLGLAFKIEPEFWLNLQAQYDLDVLRREQGKALAAEVTPVVA